VATVITKSHYSWYIIMQNVQRLQDGIVSCIPWHNTILYVI